VANIIKYHMASCDVVEIATSQDVSVVIHLEKASTGRFLGVYDDSDASSIYEMKSFRYGFPE
jgi:hypothetical protein